MIAKFKVVRGQEMLHHIRALNRAHVIEALVLDVFVNQGDQVPESTLEIRRGNKPNMHRELYSHTTMTTKNVLCGLFEVKAYFHLTKETKYESVWLEIER